LVFVVFLTISSYSNTLTNFFLDDDYGFLITPFFTHNKSILYFISHRPVEFIPNVFAYFFWACLAKLAGPNSLYHHLTSVILHIIAAYLFFLYIKRIDGDATTGIYAAVLVSVGCVYAESVARIMHMQYPLCAVFFLCSLLLLFSGKGMLSFACFIFALMCKETALIIPFIAAVSDFLFRGYKEILRKKRIYTVFFVVVIVYLAVKFTFLKEFGSMGYLIDGEVPYIVFLRERGFLSGAAVYMGRLLTIPFKYIVISINRFVFGGYTPVLKATLITVSCLPIMTYALLNIRRFLSDKLVIFGAIWVIFNALPFFYLLDSIDYNNGGLINTRYLYFPAMGFMLILARSLQQLGRMEWLRMSSRAFFVAATFLFAVILYGNNSAYRYAAGIARTIPLQTREKFPLFKGSDTEFYFLNTDDELYYAKGVHLFKNGGLDGAFLLVYGFLPRFYIVDGKEYSERLRKYNYVPDYLLSEIDFKKAASKGYILRWDRSKERVVDAADYYRRF